MKLVIGNSRSRAIITYKDNAHPELLQKLRKYLRYKVQGHRFTKAGKENRWDGYTYLITTKGEFATGFVPNVVSYLDSLGVNIEVEDQRVNMPALKEGDWEFSHGKYTLYPHQQMLCESVDDYLKIGGKWVWWPRGIWNAATNSGKTVAAAFLIHNLQSPKAILLVAERGLMQQHYDFYSDFFGKENIGIIHGKKYEIGNILTIAMIKTLGNRLKEDVNVARDLAQFNVHIVDECHDMLYKDAVKVHEAINAGMKLFMSGTPTMSSSNKNNLYAVGLSGPEIATVTKKYLMDNGFSLTPIIRVYKNPTPMKHSAYPQEYAGAILESEERAELVADLIHERASKGKKVMIAYFQESHGRLMYNKFLLKYPKYRNITDNVHGKMRDRVERINRYIDNETRILFTSSIMRQGYNIPDINTIIYTMGEKSGIDLSQFMGRGERLDGVNTTFEWIDFFDRGKWLSKHSRKRIAFYKKEQLEVIYEYANRGGTPKETKAVFQLRGSGRDKAVRS